MHNFMLMMIDLMLATFCGCVGLLFISLAASAAIGMFYAIIPKKTTVKTPEEKPTQPMILAKQQLLLLKPSTRKEISCESIER